MVDSLLSFLDVASKVLAAIAVTLGGLTIIFQSGISEWIKNRFAQAVSKELENHKHKLNVELETYKTSLLRDLEKFRADTDIHRAISLQRASAKLEALRALFADTNSFVGEALIIPTFPHAIRHEVMATLMQKYAKAHAAYRNAEIFLSVPLRQRVSRLLSRAHTFAMAFQNDENLIDTNDQRILDILKDNNEIDDLIRAELEAIASPSIN